MRNKVATLKRLLGALLVPSQVGYAGATSTASDARDVFTRWRRGESLLDGSHIAEYERALSDYYGGLHAITFGAGRMALYAILKAMRLQDGDEIICPGYTCIVTPNAIRFAGLKTVYADVSRDDFNVLPEAVEKAITPRTRAILAQHTFGIACDMDALGGISRRHGIPIVEDGAHAIGARWDGQLLGRFGYAAFYSTEGSKMFSTERGGFAVTGDADLAQRIRVIQEESEFRSEAGERACLLRWCYRAAFVGNPRWGPRVQVAEFLLKRLRLPGVRGILDYSAQDYADEVAGRRVKPYPARLPNLMAYAGLLQLRRLEEDLAHRRRLAVFLEERLPPMGAKVAVYDPRRASPSWVRFPFVVADREPWASALRAAGLVPGVWLNDPLHPRGSDWQKAGYERGMCPNAEYLSEHILNVPVDRRVSIGRLQRWLGVCDHG
ncbi:MAG TPA: DegT/DnrJ/EryC1/StrS family aminotransferase [Phycisphaerae bacterium]|nr:DegT/DnrJ/EryC1/StrS family aminotransferase [Phycisphaerae bacterium]